MFKIGIWGQYGDGGMIADGQAVRTTIITRELQMRYGKEYVGVVNTNGWRSHPIKFLWESFRLIAKSENVAIAPADNGYKIFVPFLMFFNRFYRRKLIHIVIGGFLPALLKKKPYYLKMENKFAGIFVQTENIKKDLAEIGIRHLYILSNPKRLNTRKIENIPVNKDEQIRVCVFSRLNKDKGVEDALAAVKIANEKLGGQKIKLDFFGLIQPGFNEWFHSILESNEGLVEYKGIVDFDKTVEALTPYFALFFPTYYYGEGFPGNVVDAYYTGLPIIATDWLYNKDVIKDGRNGILVPIKNPQALADALIRLYNDRNLHHQFVANNIEDSKMYSPDVVLKDLYSFID